MAVQAQSTPAMQVPLLDLKPQYRTMAGEIQAAIEKVCESQQFILGPGVKELEASVASYSQCRHGIGVSSGTDALLVALMALGIGPGDAVITSPFTFFATAGTIARAGARPLFCDIDPVTFNLSPAALETFIERYCERRGGELLHRGSGARVRALMPVHLYGQVADMLPLMESARRYGLKVIEDAAQAIGVYDAAFRRARLDEAVRTPHACLGVRHIYNQYVIRARERDALRAHLTAAGVGTEIYYPVPLHLQQCFAYLGCKVGDYPQSERAAAETLALPIYPELTEVQLHYVVDTIAAYYRL